VSLRDYATEELVAELERRGTRALTGIRDGRPCPPCRCGPARKEIVEPEVVNFRTKFVPRIGCLTCDTWDEPVRLVDQ
jgi:hypothetical protein